MPNLVIYNARLVDEHTDAFGAVLISMESLHVLFCLNLTKYDVPDSNLSLPKR